MQVKPDRSAFFTTLPPLNQIQNMKITFQALLTLFSLFLALNAFAKKGDKVPGYIVFEDGTKTQGIVVIGSITDNEVKVAFIENGKSKKTVYRPADLISYGFQEIEKDEFGQDIKRWVHYDRFEVDYPPKIFASTTVFMEREVKGTVSVYCYYIEVRNDPKKPYRYFYYLKDQNDNIQKVERESFPDLAKSVFKNYTALTDRIGKKSFEYRNLDRMVRDYNYWVVNQHNSKEYRVAMIQK
jgi:hypothetical protein